MTEKPNPRLQFTAPLQHPRNILPWLSLCQEPPRDPHLVTTYYLISVKIWRREMLEIRLPIHFRGKWNRRIGSTPGGWNTELANGRVSE
jgi:hypothetical protein